MFEVLLNVLTALRASSSIFMSSLRASSFFDPSIFKSALRASSFFGASRLLVRRFAPLRSALRVAPDLIILISVGATDL
jgi:hypothetical protein